jgi:hypothetical protein
MFFFLFYLGGASGHTRNGTERLVHDVAIIKKRREAVRAGRVPNYSVSLGTYLLAKRWGKGWRESEEEANKEKRCYF